MVIASGIVFWQRLFDQKKCKFELPTIVSGMLIIAISVACGGAMRMITDGFLVFEVFCVLPIIILSYIAFLGVYAKNDFKIYKRSKSYA
jgi:hypothetical protein